MADALLSAVASTIVESISSLLSEEFGITGGLKTELKRMQSTFTTIQAVLVDAEEKQWTSEAIKDWLRKLKATAYEVEDILDDFAANTPRGTQVNTLSRFPKQLSFHFKMAHKLRNVREKLDAIAGERSKFHLTEGIRAVEDRQVSDRETSSLVDESEVVGRDKEVEKVINMVLNNSAGDQDHGISVYAIWGMGGLGKTTLAQLVYNNERVGKAFDLRSWVCVSDDFDIKTLTKAIIESIGGDCSSQQLDLLQRHLQEKLSGKRFLLVLDDVWNEVHHKWDGLKKAFKHGAKGSIVMVTTRGQNVAQMMATAPNSIHHLGCLSYDDSWSLFKQLAFRMGKSEDYPQLEALGKEIVNKCGGVPLAIKALGSLMSSKERESEWLAIKESNMWELEDEGNRVLEVLRLSYRHLKPHWRQCFAFCSLFPKDSILERDHLIQLWMANGFVPSNGHVSLHDAGCQIFNELARRSFFQEIEDFEGDVTCKMHDLIHDLAQSILGSECCVVERGQVGLTVPKTVRHMFARSGTPNLHNVNFLRSLIVKAKKKGEEEFYLKIATKQKHLRALEVSFYSITMNLSFDNFRHLRYLNFRGFNISTLPESISSLRNLQTLNLRDCRQLRTLPKGLKHLKSLIYLDIGGCISLTCMPDGLGQLSSLRVLSKFIVGKDHGCHIDELKEMALEGELRIKELDNVKSSADARSANLNMKQNLRSLSLEWRESKSNDGARDENGEDVLTGLQPHPNLKKLSITSYHGARFSNWLMDLLVVEISLEKCGRCECLPPLGKLSFLKVLDIFRMDALKSIDSSFYGDGETSFPSLESLRLTHMPCLEEWTTINDGRESFPLLSSLTITNCPKLVEIPPVLELSLKSLQIYGNFTISLLNSVVHLTSLTFLSVYGLIDLTVVPEGVLQHHKHLEELALSGLRRLKSLSDVLDNLSALKHLKISFCDELESLPAGLENLSSLESLLLFRCDSLVGLPENGLRGLSSLSILSIKNCEKLESLSEGVRYLTSLRDLQIWECPELKSLPESIQHLTSLSSLRIDRCENLMSLPRGLQSLTALKELSITECPNVERRCKAEGGEDWPFIAHIPTVQIRSGKEYSRR